MSDRDREHVRNDVQKLTSCTVDESVCIDDWLYSTAISTKAYLDRSTLKNRIRQVIKDLHDERQHRRALRLEILRNLKHPFTQHVCACQDNECQVPHCFSSKKLWRDHAQCDASCTVCAAVAQGVPPLAKNNIVSVMRDHKKAMRLLYVAALKAPEP